MRCERLTAQDRTIVWHRCFKAFGIDAPIWECTLFLTLFLTADAGDVVEDVSEPTAEDVAFEFWHLQRFLDGVCEAVACEAEVLEHGGIEVFIPSASAAELMKF